MSYLLGTDEAGYGPNLGPLIITATLWRVPGEPREVDLYPRLASAVVNAPPNKTDEEGDVPPLFIADSKAVYHKGQGFALLERAVLAALGSLDPRPASWRGLWNDLAPEVSAHDGSPLHTLPWYAGFDCPVPLEAKGPALDHAAARLTSALGAAGVELCGIRGRALFPEEFNRRVCELDSKGAVLSQATISLAAEMLAELPPEPVWMICDKHGGRNRYGPLLQQQFPDPLIEVGEESRARSIYRWPRRGATVETHFCRGAEVHLPVALASMAAKYLRETAMRAFNQFWRRHVPGLRPTAGYPVDARRFKADIAPEQRRLGIADDVLWRER